MGRSKTQNQAQVKNTADHAIDQSVKNTMGSSEIDGMRDWKSAPDNHNGSIGPNIGLQAHQSASKYPMGTKREIISYLHTQRAWGGIAEKHARNGPQK